MATSYNRRINLFINGKEVSNDIRSIRAEMTKLVNEQARMTIGSQEYIQHTRKIRELKGILAEHNQQIAAVSKSWSFAKMGDSFNRYFSMLQAGAAALVGLVLGFKALVKVYNDFEERVSNLSALTGLTGKNLEWLAEKAKELSTATLEGGIRVTQNAQEIVDAFTKVGSARPELLKNKEALAKVTEEAIILSNASKIKLQPAIEGLCMVMNQYNVSADESRRIINVLGAGSKEGAGEIPYLTVGFEKAGTTASMAGISIEKLAATLETLAPRFSQPEIAGRGLRGMLLHLQTGADDTNPAIVGLSTALENLDKKMLTPKESLKMFGLENINVANTLIRNREELKRYEKAMTGTNVAIEQAQINTDNNNAKLAQAGNRINIVANDLGKRLTPAMHTVTGYFGMFLRSLIVLIDVFTVYGRVIVTSALAIAGYTVAVKLQTMWQNRANQATLGQIVVQRAQIILTATSIIATNLWAAAVMLLTGNFRGAAQAMRVVNSTFKLNPIGLLTTAVIAGVSAWQYYIQKQKDAAEAANATKKILEEEMNLTKGYSSELIKEQNNLGALVGSIIRTNENEAIRSVLIKNLRDQYPSFLGLMTSEKITNELLALKLAEVNGQYAEKIRLAALNAKSTAYNNASIKAEERKLAIEDELVQVEKERYRIGDPKSDEQVSKLNLEYENLNSTLSNYKLKQEEISLAIANADKKARESTTLKYTEDQLTYLSYVRSDYTQKIKKAQEAENADVAEHYRQQLKLVDDQILLMQEKKKDLLPSPSKSPSSNLNFDGEGDESKRTTDLVALKEQELEAAKRMPGSTKIEVAARNIKVEAIQKEIEVLNNLGKTHSELADKEERLTDKEEKRENKKTKKELELLEAANKSKVALINKDHLEGKTTDDQYDAELFAQELVYLQSKMNLFKIGSKQYEEAHALFLEKQVKAEQLAKNLILKANKELAETKIENLRDGIEKEKALEEQRWKDELTALKKRLNDKKDLTRQDLELNETINQIIEEKTKAHVKKTTDLNRAGELEKQMDKAIIDTANAQSDETRWAAETEMARVQHDQEIKEAEGNAAKIARAERNLSDKLIAIKAEELDKRQAIGDAIFGAATTLFGSLADLVGKESALGKAMFLFQQAAAIGQIVFNTAIANAKAVAASPLTFGQPWVTINTVTAGVSIASVLAQTIGQLSGSSKKSKGYASGGYTGDGDLYEPAGIVHKGEYVIPQAGVKNPRLQPLINIFEMARKNNRLARLDLNPKVQLASRTGGFVSGGYVTAGLANPQLTNQTRQSPDPELLAAIKELNKQLKAGIKANAYINKYGRNGLDEAISDITKFKKQVYKS